MLLTRWHRGMLWLSGVGFLGTTSVIAMLGYRAWLAWQGMEAESLKWGDPMLRLAHVLPHFIVLSGFGLLSLFTGTLSLLSLRWFEQDGSRKSLQRRLTGVAWGVRLTVILGPILLVLALLNSLIVPNDLYSSTLVPFNLVVMLMLTGITLFAGPIMLLGWLGLGYWQRWTRAAVDWTTQPGRSGELHRRFTTLRRSLIIGAAVLLGLFVWLIPEAWMGLTWGGRMLAIERLIVDQRQLIIRLLELELLLGGLLLLAWRGAGEALCHELDPQASPLADLLQNSRPADTPRQVSAMRV